jgi:hypothetical protein
LYLFNDINFYNEVDRCFEYDYSLSPLLGWEEANEECSLMGGKLMKIRKDFDLEYLKYMITMGARSTSTGMVWIGAKLNTTFNSIDNWLWLDGQILKIYSNIWFQTLNDNDLLSSLQCTSFVDFDKVTNRDNINLIKPLNCSTINSYVCEFNFCNNTNIINCNANEYFKESIGQCGNF